MKKKNEFSCPFGHNIISKTTELVLLFYKNINKPVFLWTNMGQRKTGFKIYNRLYEISNEDILSVALSFLNN